MRAASSPRTEAHVDVTINGERRTFDEPMTIADILETLGIPVAGVAVARNATVVRRTALAQERVAPGDAIEIIRAVPGG